MMGSIATNRRVVITAMLLSCLSILAVQSFAEDGTKTPGKPSAQKIISQWKAIFPDQPYVCWQKESPWKGLDNLDLNIVDWFFR